MTTSDQPACEICGGPATHEIEALDTSNLDDLPEDVTAGQLADMGRTYKIHVCENHRGDSTLRKV